MKLYWVCWLAFGVSFALPALDDVQPSPALERFVQQGMSRGEVPQGPILGHEAALRVWDALRAAWSHDRSVRNLAEPIVWNLPNACFALMALALLLRFHRVAALLGSGAVAAAAYWPLQSGLASHLGWGFLLWAGSMAATTVITWVRVLRSRG